jgi:hypothetical protein
MTDQTADRLDALRAEYANTGGVMSDGAVWLFSQVVVLREQVDRLRAASAVVPAADRAAPELTAEEARDLAEDLGYQLYRAQDALAFVGECCDIADRERRPVTTADVREWLKGARCGRQLLAEAADRAAVLSDVERKMLNYALNQAQLRMWKTGKFTDEGQAALVSLRRLAVVPAVGVAADTSAEDR